MELKESKDINLPGQPPAAMPRKAQPYRSRLKYYIHDSIESLRLELTGELTEGDTPELNGCWRTAKTTLGNRNLILDIRRLRAADEAGRQWLHSMSVEEKASLLPKGPLHLQYPGEAGSLHDLNDNISGRWLEKLVSFFRGDRVSVVKSSTPAP